MPFSQLVAELVLKTEIVQLQDPSRRAEMSEKVRNSNFESEHQMQYFHFFDIFELEKFQDFFKYQNAKKMKILHLVLGSAKMTKY